MFQGNEISAHILQIEFLHGCQHQTVFLLAPWHGFNAARG